MASRTKNYYDILNVRSDCDNKEIKTAYVQLSKKYHPDVKSINSDSQQTAHFLKITEAYQTLSKPKLRMEYDQTLKAAQFIKFYETGSSTKIEIHRPWEIKPNYDPNPGPYYGIKGLNRQTNSKVAWAIIGLATLGGVFVFVSIKHLYSQNSKRLDKISALASEHHQKIRSEVEKYTKDEQLQRVIDRLTVNSQK